MDVSLRFETRPSETVDAVGGLFGGGVEAQKGRPVSHRRDGPCGVERSHTDNWLTTRFGVPKRCTEGETLRVNKEVVQYCYGHPKYPVNRHKVCPSLRERILE